jgi:hypothetical protein
MLECEDFYVPFIVVQSKTMDLNISQIRFKTALVITLMVGFVNQSYGRTWPYASAQLIEPKWNWEEVILSRNGPSTTTPKPTTTQYTTLRNVIGKNIKPVRAFGSSGSVEAAPLVPRHERGRADPLTISPNSANQNQLHFSTVVLASCLMLLTIRMNPFQINNSN